MTEAPPTSIAPRKVLFVVKDLTLYEPLGILYLASSLRRAGHEARLCVAAEEDPKAAVRDFKPDVVAYHCWTGRHRYYVDLNLELKRERDFVSVFGGPHPTFFPELVNEPGVDAVCRGEGEAPFLHFLEHFGNGRAKTPSFLARDGERVVSNPMMRLDSDLDAIPFPDREMIYSRNEYFRKRKLKYLMAGRGCPYTCSYCFNHAFNKLYDDTGSRIVRKRSVDNIVAEIEWMRSNWPLEMVLFFDDIFLTTKAWLVEFAKKWRNEVGLPFIAEVVPNQINAEVALLLKEAGCISVFMGIEAGNDELRRGALDRRVKRETILDAAAALKKNGIKINSLNMVGLPGETLDMALETVRLNREAKIDFGWSAIFQPYPGTALADYARENGFWDGNVEKISYTYHADTIIETRGWSPREVSNLHKLFGLAVEFPVPESVLRALIKLPLTPLYRFLYTLWYGYAIKNRISPYRTSLGEFVESVKRFFRKDEG